ncbi:MAG TPA: hypothetical protein VGX25_04135 [Actinophytocola sp.]|uniref:hypothetical protein n=1 Tax=Actinophytocola sp. TaxID=1872138 RepID=UPI002DDD2B8B|nr:hypothetical protein [Actinophytocola sp.]HEV2778568.1 hypothetical protein [Actinophytocola sp.]
MRWQIEPMDRWPYPESSPRKSNPFRAKFDDTLKLLAAELDHLKVTGAVAVRVVTREADVRQDGMLRARATVLHPGVALSFRSATAGALTYPCDRFVGYVGEADWQVNLRAIALGLEALRKLDRYGIAGHGEQYTGWRAIEPGDGFATADDAIRWLRNITGIDNPDVSTGPLLRRAAAVLHPDRNNGERKLWDRYDAARQLLQREGRAS